MRAAILALTLLLPPASLFANGGCEDFEAEAAQRMIAASTVRQLDDAFTAARHRDLPLIALYRSRRLALNPTAAEELRYFRALPKSEDELFCVYRLTDPGPMGNAPAVDETVYAMFDRAAAIARKHELGYTRVLRLALWADGELAAGAWGWYDAIMRDDRARLVAAIRKLPAGEQRRLCGGVVRSLPARAIAERCRRYD